MKINGKLPQHSGWQIAGFYLLLSFGCRLEAVAMSQPQTSPQNSDASLLLPLQPAETQPQPLPQAIPSLTPTPKGVPPQPEQTAPVLNRIGLVQQIQSDQITLKSISGSDKTYEISSQLESFPRMQKGTLVSYRLSQNQVAEVDLPVVKNVFEGVLIVVEKDVLGLVSAAGERKYTTLQTEKIASLKLTPGQTVRVLEFEGIRTKVICAPQTGKRAPIYLGEIEGALHNF